ncbi:MAG: HAD hydrolase family protein [Bifidobacteriaceae bacterium]|jgi:Cof subfamily protein (haloacid dehalogenase superfamily)|nr:HAD hydrolase family protein [Bifidobacteriaceae bacterium]
MVTAPAADLGRFRAVVLDIDGTLAGADHRVSPFAAEVVRRLAAAGPKVIISTGRSQLAATRLALQVGANAPVISANGAVVADFRTGQRLRLVGLAPDLVAHYLTLADRPGVEAMIWTPDDLICAGPGLMKDLMDLADERPVTFRPRAEWPSDGVVKVLFGAEPSLLDALDLADYPLIQRSLSHFIEATDAAARKDSALTWLLARLGVSPDQTIVFGDAETDLASVRLAGLGVAVAGAIPQVRAAAGAVIGANSDDAVAHYLNQGYALGAR